MNSPKREGLTVRGDLQKLARMIIGASFCKCSKINIMIVVKYIVVLSACLTNMAKYDDCCQEI